MKIVFMGTPAYATTIFETLINDKTIEVVLLITQEDKPVGRKQLLTPPHIKEWALEKGLQVEIFQPKTLRSFEVQAKIASFKPDFIIVAAYGKILPKEILDIAPCINLHASLLPKYRGASPIQSSLLASEKYTGVTSMLMEEGLDTGAMLGFSHLKLEDENAEGLFKKLAKHAAILTLKTLKNFNAILPLIQTNANATYCKKIKKEDGLVCFETQSAEEIYIKFKALSPWPGIFLSSGLKLHDIAISHCSENFPASVILKIDKNGVVISCKKGCLLLRKVQPFSKSVMGALDYIRGKRLDIGHTVV